MSASKLACERKIRNRLRLTLPRPAKAIRIVLGMIHILYRRGRLFTAINRKYLATNPAGIIRRQKEHAVGDVVGLAEALQCNTGHQRLLHLWAVGFPLALGIGVGQHKPGGDVVDGNVEWPKFVTKLAGQIDLAGFGSGIGLDAGQAGTEAGATRNVDNPAGAGRLHARRHGLGEIKGCAHIDGDDVVPLRDADVFDRLTHLTEHTPGVVDQNIDGAAGGTGAGLGHKGSDLGHVGDIDGAYGAVAAGVNTALLGFGELAGNQVAGPDMGAALRKGHGDGAPKAVGSAGDDDGFGGKFNMHGGGLSVIKNSAGSGGIPAGAHERAGFGDSDVPQRQHFFVATLVVAFVITVAIKGPHFFTHQIDHTSAIRDDFLAGG